MHIIQHPDFLEKVKEAKVLYSKRKLYRVYLTPAGHIIKVIHSRKSFYRTKRRVNRIVTNCKKLQQYNLDTIKIIKIEKYKESNAFAIYYSYIQGKSLAEFFMENSDIDLLYQAITILLFLHQHNIYFLDYHPGNIILSEDNTLFLIDIETINFSWFPLPMSRCINDLAIFLVHFTFNKCFSEKEISAAINQYIHRSKFFVKKEMFLEKLTQQINYNHKNKKNILTCNASNRY